MDVTVTAILPRSTGDRSKTSTGNTGSRKGCPRTTIINRRATRDKPTI